tara:strand:- start:206 stop:448 length:243 start_codon:yes stop_codon:yes gene_type:complete
LSYLRDRLIAVGFDHKDLKKEREEMDITIKDLKADIDELKEENAKLLFQNEEMSKDLGSKCHRIRELEHRLKESSGRSPG